LSLNHLQFSTVDIIFLSKMERVFMRTYWQLFIIPFICIFLSFNTVFAQQPLATGKSKFLGCGTSASIYRYLNSYWNQVTPGNEGKWGSVEITQGTYNWTNLDKIYNYANKKGFVYKHHNLIWGSQQPSWITSLDSSAQRSAIEKWVDTVGKRYPQMSFVDVVNEPLHAPPAYKNALGGDGSTGWDWVITSFQLARNSFPSETKLLLNEYNVLHSNSVTTSYLNIINLLRERGLIDGIGIQGHYFEFRGEVGSSNPYVYDINTIKYNLNRLIETGLPVYITEFDIDEPVDSVQLEQYKIYFPIFWNNPGVKGMTLWGYYEYDVWTSHPNTYLIRKDDTERPALQWLRNFVKSPFPPIPDSPVNKSGIERNPIIVWNSAETANSYRLQIATKSYFPLTSIVLDTTIVDTLIQISPLASSTQYYWRVCGTNEYGSSDYSTVSSFVTGDQIVSVDGQGIAIEPKEFVLLQNFPNPFNPTTTIRYGLPVTSNVKITVYDMLGREIAMLVDGMQHANNYSIQWNASHLSSGVYFYRIDAKSVDGTKNFTSVKELLLLK